MKRDTLPIVKGQAIKVEEMMHVLETTINLEISVDAKDRPNRKNVNTEPPRRPTTSVIIGKMGQHFLNGSN